MTAVVCCSRRSTNIAASETRLGSASLGSAAAAGNDYVTFDPRNVQPSVTSTNVDDDVNDLIVVDNDLYE